MTDNADVVTTAGTVRGSREQAGNSGRTISVFRGVPYAAPPLGALRFKAPEPPEPWSGIREATQAAPSPMQSTNNPFSGVIPGNLVGAVSEDCLTVDIWSPATPGENLPVLVWVYGGAYLTGGSTLVTYDGSTLAADHGVVVVSVNYRLGAMGFLWLDDKRAEANCGLRDQLAGLQWVRDNVAAFGGDPSNVTVFGESAGAGSLLHLVTAPGAADVLHRCILQSPGVDHTLRPDDASRVTDIFLSHVGVDQGELERLWDLPAEAIVDAQETTLLETLFTISSMPFHPVVDRTFSERHPIGGVCQRRRRRYRSPGQLDGRRNAPLPQPGGRRGRYRRDHRVGAALPHRPQHRRPRPGPSPTTGGLLRGSHRRLRTLDPCGHLRGDPDRWGDATPRPPDCRRARGERPGGDLCRPVLLGCPRGGRSLGAGRLPRYRPPVHLRHPGPGRLGRVPGGGAGRRAAGAVAYGRMVELRGYRRPGRSVRTRSDRGARSGPRYDNQRRATMILDTTCEVRDDPLAVIVDAWDGLWSADSRPPSHGGRVTPAKEELG